MSQLHYDENLQPGLFTFYMAQNQQYENYEIICPTLPLKQFNANYQLYGRKLQGNAYTQQNAPNQEDRTQKLNKFLSNCVGGRRNKSNENQSHKNGWDPEKQQIIQVKQSNNLRKSKKQSKKQTQGKAVIKLKKEWKIKQIESQIGAKKLLSVKKLNINEEMLQERSTRNKKIKITNYQPLPSEKQKENKQSLKLNGKQNYKEKEKQREERLTEEDINQIKQYFQNYQEQHAPYSGNKVRQLKLLANIYPSLIKHHSQQLLIQPSKNTITVRSLISKNSDNYQPTNKQDLQKDLRDKNQISIGEKLDKKICITLQKKKSPLCLALPLIESKQKQNRLRIHQSNRVQSKQVNFRISLLSAQNNRRIGMDDVVGNKYKYHAKRTNRLELGHKNKKNTVNLPPLHIGEGSIEREKQINEIYYSVDHRQKKPLEINVGICPNNRLIEGWEERKKALIQKISVNDQKQSKNMNRKKTNTKNSIKNFKQNRIEIKSKKK